MTTILDIQRKYQQHEKITMVTCYDYWTASILANTTVDSLLVGDSLAMVMYGHKNTLAATIDMMAQHTAAVARGAGDKFIVADMPFLSYRKSLNYIMSCVEQLIQAGAHAIKLEGADSSNYDVIQHIVSSGVPVMGHLGMTPQSINQFGGFRVQGKDQKAANDLLAQAKMLAKSGCFAIVLECMPPHVANAITNQINIPTIGIGAGSNVSGQILVLHDLLGVQNEFLPKFVKKYTNGYDIILNATNQYSLEVRSATFPGPEHAYG